MANIEGDRRRAPWGRLETEFAELRAKLVEQAAVIDKLIAENAGLTVEVARLKAQLGMNSKNSSRPPSSDGYAKPAPKSRRGRSGNRPHEQPGAPVGNLVAVGEPDVVVVHAPGRCGGCAAGLADASVVGEVTRQVFDLPPVKAVITEHRAPCAASPLRVRDRRDRLVPGRGNRCDLLRAEPAGADLLPGGAPAHPDQTGRGTDARRVRDTGIDRHDRGNGPTGRRDARRVPRLTTRHPRRSRRRLRHM